MRKLVSFLLLGFLAACNNAPVVAATKDVNTDSATSAAPMPYVVDKITDWEIGNEDNIRVAMNALKSWEMNDTTKMSQYMADSVDFYYDGGQFKGPADSFITMLTQHRNTYKNVSIKMHDYESVKSKNRNEQWVGLWYTEITTDSTGKVDSAMTMDDLKIENGKVRLIDTKIRKLK
jgi:hypothetical protein